MAVKLQKVALVHDWLISMSGAERVLIELHRLFPEAPIYTLFQRSSFTESFLPGVTIRTSFLQSIPMIDRSYRFFVGLMPSAIESFDLSDFDVVISSSAVFSKGLVLRPQTKHICYCYSPSRFLWDRHAEYESRSSFSYLIRHFLRLWDRPASDRVDQFVAISEHVQKRIQKYYRRQSMVVYPPLTQAARPSAPIVPFETGSYYLIVSRLYPHKNIRVAVEAFNKLGKPLVIIGTGPQAGRLKRMAQPNIHLIGWQPDETVNAYYRCCRAFVMPQEEDFGLTPLEAMAQGRPVLALGRGGALEIVIEGETGEFFDDPIPEGISDGVRRLEENLPSYNSAVIENRARQFSVDRFRQGIKEVLS